MGNFSSKQVAIVALVAVVLAGIGLFAFFALRSEAPEPPGDVSEEPTTSWPEREIIGMSVQNRNIESYTYLAAGQESTHLTFVGGIHGGYEWNSVLLAYAFMDYIEGNPEVVPDTITVSVIPNANPDGVYEIIGKEGRFRVADVPAGDASSGRFNANNVDLNRNFDCKWQPQSTWRGSVVSAGTEPFSEPEAAAIRDFVLEQEPDAVVFWHSQANAVYASECENGILPETLNIMQTYATAANYQAVESFDAYEITGDVEGWLASIGIPAVTVELQTHETIEWERNRAGVEALFEYYRQN